MVVSVVEPGFRWRLWPTGANPIIPVRVWLLPPRSPPPCIGTPKAPRAGDNSRSLVRTPPCRVLETAEEEPLRTKRCIRGEVCVHLRKAPGP